MPREMLRGIAFSVISKTTSVQTAMMGPFTVQSAKSSSFVLNKIFSFE